METKDYVIIGSGVVSLASLVFGIFEYSQNKKLTKRIGTSIDHIMDMSSIDISDLIVEEATRDAVMYQVEKQAKAISVKVQNDIEADIRKDVDSAVRQLKSEVKGTVKDELERKAKQVSVNDIRDEVISELKSRAGEKVDRKIDDVVESHTEKLEEITKVYETINKSLSKKAKG